MNTSKGKMFGGLGVFTSPTEELYRVYQVKGKTHRCAKPDFLAWRRCIEYCRENNIKPSTGLKHFESFRTHIKAMGWTEGLIIKNIHRTIGFNRAEMGLSDVIVMEENHRNCLISPKARRGLPPWVDMADPDKPHLLRLLINERNADLEIVRYRQTGEYAIPLHMIGLEKRVNSIRHLAVYYRNKQLHHTASQLTKVADHMESFLVFGKPMDLMTGAEWKPTEMKGGKNGLPKLMPVTEEKEHDYA